MGKSENWTIVLTPHRSLSREGFVTVMTIVAVMNLVIGFTFFLIGAWPVIGFLGLDVVLIWWAFTRNFADAQRVEKISVIGDELTLSRVVQDGEQEATVFNRRWVRVELEYDADRELTGKLFLRSHGQNHEIGAFLGAHERQSLAKALRQSI